MTPGGKIEEEDKREEGGESGEGRNKRRDGRGQRKKTFSTDL